jgi:hypothetical protein
MLAKPFRGGLIPAKGGARQGPKDGANGSARSLVY